MQSTASDHTATGVQTGAVRPAIRVTCPQCGQILDVVPVEPAQTITSDASAFESIGQRGRQVLRSLADRFFPMYESFAAARAESLPEASNQEPVSGKRRWLLLALVSVMIVIVVALIFWGRQGHAEFPSVSSRPQALPTTQARAGTNSEAAIMETLTRYNAAETEAAALLRIEPIQPYLDPGGPFAERRATELAERQQRNASHRSILLRWGIGDISVNGTTATVVTQETWSNQEAGAVAPDQATVRVTYTLRWDAAAGRWLIMESEQMGL